MKGQIKSCKYNMDTACVELRFTDGSMIAIDTTAVEKEVADNMYQRSELDYLIYNDPVAYANLNARKREKRGLIHIENLAEKLRESAI